MAASILKKQLLILDIQHTDILTWILLKDTNYAGSAFNRASNRIRQLLQTLR